MNSHLPFGARQLQQFLILVTVWPKGPVYNREIFLKVFMGANTDSVPLCVSNTGSPSADGAIGILSIMLYNS